MSRRARSRWSRRGSRSAAAGIGLVSAERVRDQLAVIEACEATEPRRFRDGARAHAGARRRQRDRTRRGGVPLPGAARDARAAHECAELLAGVLADPRSEDWAPRPDLAIHAIQTWRDEGRTAEAAELARRAARAHPDDAQLFALELSTRSSVEDEDTRAGGARGARRASARMRPSRCASPSRTAGCCGASPRARSRCSESARPRTRRTRSGTGSRRAAARSRRPGDLAAVQRNYARWRDGGRRSRRAVRTLRAHAQHRRAEGSRTPSPRR